MLPWSLILPHFFFEDEGEFVYPVDPGVAPTFARSAKPSSARVTTRVAALTTRPLILERRVPVTGGALLNSMVEHVCVGLAGDVDAPYYLIHLAAQRAVALIRKMRQAMQAADAAITNIQNPGGTTTSVFSKISDILASPSGTPAERAQLVERFTAATMAYAASIKNEQGSVALGQHVYTSADDLLAALDEYAVAAQELSEFYDRFTTCMERYAALDVAAAPFQAQLLAGSKALQGASDKPSEAAVDALILASMLKTRATTQAPTGLKYAGPAVAQTTDTATLLGVGTPFVAPASAEGPPTAVVTVGSATGTLTMSSATVLSPTLTVPLDATRFVKTETGALTQYNNSFNVTTSVKQWIVPGTMRLSFASPAGAQTVSDVPFGLDMGAFSNMYATGVVNYKTGGIAVASTGWWGWPAVTGTLLLTYQYSPLGDLRTRNPSTGVIATSYQDVQLYAGNTLLTRTLMAPTGGIVSIGALDTLLVAAFAGSPLTVRAQNGVLTAAGSVPGTAAVVACPDGTAAQLNTAFGGPTWTVPPTTVNAALGALNASAQGTDASVVDVVVPPALQPVVVVSTADTPVLADTAYVMTGTAQLPMPDFTPVGATVRVVGYVTSLHRVVSVTSGVGTIYPPVTFAPGASTQAVTYAVDNIVLQLDARVSGDAIVVGATTNGGLGLSGTAYPVPRTIAHDWPDASVTLRPGDLVVQGGNVVTDVAHTSSGSVILTDPLQLQQPVSALNIYSLGWTSHAALCIALKRLTSVQQLFDNTYVRATARYGFSRLDQAVFVSTEQTTYQTLQALEDAFTQYRANKVASVDALLQYLREERFTGTIQALMNLDFENALNPDVAVLSSTLEADQLLVELTSVLQQAGDQVVVGAVAQPNDYVDRPRDMTVGTNGRVL